MLIYTLLLAGGHRYVGRAENQEKLELRLAEHREGRGAEWTKRYAVQEVESVLANARSTDEDARVIELMAQHGVDMVRGGTFCTPVLDETEKRVLSKMVDTARGTCYLCHAKGHCTNECPVNAARSEKNGGDWLCPDCGNHVFASKNECRCGKRKPVAYTKVATASGGLEPGWKAGDWRCGGCGDHQYASNAKCRQCGTLRGQPPQAKRAADGPAEGEPAEKKARVEVKSGDWDCASCNVHNFASRTACFRCHKARPLPDAAQVATCVICLDRPVRLLVQPCRHLCLCEGCGELASDKCPICRGPITSKDLVFQ